MKYRWPIPAAAVTAMLIAGCSGASSTPTANSTAATSQVTASASPSPSPTRPRTKVLERQILSLAKNATSVHITGSGLPGGTRPLGANMSITRSGGLSGTISEGGATITLLVTHGRTYFKVDAAFLKLQKVPHRKTVCALMCGKWLTVSAKTAKPLTRALNWNKMFGSFGLLSKESLKYAGTATVNGQPAWELVSLTGGKVYVAASATPYVLRVTPPAGQKGKADFSQWNTATIPPRPPASEVVNLSQLGA